MKHSFFVFAAGWPGVALLLLRVSVGVFLITVPPQNLGQSLVAGVAVNGLAITVLLGLNTRIAALLACLVAAGLMIGTRGSVSMPLSAHGLDALVLAMAGPGAYSIDSLLFGRRTFVLPD